MIKLNPVYRNRKSLGLDVYLPSVIMDKLNHGKGLKEDYVRIMKGINKEGIRKINYNKFKSCVVRLINYFINKGYDNKFEQLSSENLKLIVGNEVLYRPIVKMLVRRDILRIKHSARTGNETYSNGYSFCKYNGSRSWCKLYRLVDSIDEKMSLKKFKVTDKREIEKFISIRIYGFSYTRYDETEYVMNDVFVKNQWGGIDLTIPKTHVKFYKKEDLFHERDGEALMNFKFREEQREKLVEAARKIFGGGMTWETVETKLKGHYTAKLRGFCVKWVLDKAAVKEWRKANRPKRVPTEKQLRGFKWRQCKEFIFYKFLNYDFFFNEKIPLKYLNEMWGEIRRVMRDNYWWLQRWQRTKEQYDSAVRKCYKHIVRVIDEIKRNPDSERIDPHNVPYGHHWLRDLQDECDVWPVKLCGGK